MIKFKRFAIFSLIIRSVILIVNLSYLLSQSIVTDILRDESDNIVSIEYFNTSFNNIQLIKIEYYYTNGQLDKIENYNNGLLDGPCLEYFNNGKIKREGQYKNGEQYGVWFTYFDNGNKESIYHANHLGKLNGSITQWFENGEMKTKGNYLNDEKHGIWTYWFINGRKKRMVTYNSGNQEGIYIDYYPNGKTMKEGVIDYKGIKEERCFDENSLSIKCDELISNDKIKNPSKQRENN